MWALILFLFIYIGLVPVHVSSVKALPLNTDGEVLNYEQKPPMYDENLFEGDILGVHSYKDRSSVVDPHLLWAGGIVYYSIEESARNITGLIMEAIEEFENRTCLKFVVRPPEVADYIRIEDYAGCNSQIGRVGGAQLLSLADGCHVKTIVLHEFLHALGFYHEQSRSDRDKYVEIEWDNIQETQQHNFETADFYDNNHLDEEFDFTSLMMYEWNAWALNFSNPTIVPKKPGVELKAVWEKTDFSEGDVRKINRLYECFGEKRPAPPDVPDFVCDFEIDECDIVNQEDIGADFDLWHTRVGNRTGGMLVVNPEFVSSPYLRLITPHFKVHGRDVTCFSLDYYLQGGVQELEITQQGSDTIKVAHIDDVRAEWMTHQVTLNTSGIREVRFFVGVTLRKGVPGVAALDNFVFSRRPC